MGPLGVLLEPLGPTGKDEARAEFAAVAQICGPALALLISTSLETFSSVPELLAAIEGIRSVDATRPILASATVGSHHNEVLEEFAKTVGRLAPMFKLSGLNCSDGPQ